MSKVIDYDKIIRESFLRAKKDLGLLNEQDADQTTTPTPAKRSAFIEPFDKQKHMPTFQMKPTEWGLKGTVEADQIDAIINAVVGNKAEGAKDSLSRLKIVLQELSNNLGVQTSAYAGLKNVPEAEQASSSIKQIIASLQLKSLISSIIAQNPNAAGKIFEGLVARMVGGHSNNPSDNPIQDFVDADGNYISLKTIKATTEIKGSKGNLARGIALKGAVTYLMCIKDAEADPFKLKVFSFKVNKKNYFYFINGVTSMYELTPELKNRIRTDIATVRGYFKLDPPAGAKKTLPEAARKKGTSVKDPSEEDIQTGVVQADVINKYFEQEGGEFASKSMDEKITEFQRRLRFVIDSINITGTQQEEEYNRAIEFYRSLAPKAISGEAVWKASYDDIKNNMFFKKKDADPFKAVTWNSLKFVVKQIKKENNKFALAAIFSEDPELRKRAKEVYDKQAAGANFGDDVRYNQILSAVTRKQDRYVDEKDKLANVFNSFVDFVEKLEDAENKAKIEKFSQEATAVAPQPLSSYLQGSVAAGKTPVEDQQLESDIIKFWDDVESVAGYETLGEAEDPEQQPDQPEGETTKEPKAKKETQFELSLATVRQFAIQHQEETGYDDTYPEIVVARTQLFNSAKKNSELFKNWAEPIYENMHYLTQGINRYFLEDDVGGLSAGTDQATNMPGAIKAAEQLVVKATEVAKTGKKASEITEGKDNLKNLTKEARIVMEMLKRMEE